MNDKAAELLVRQLFLLRQIENALSDDAEAIVRDLFDELVSQVAKLDPTAVQLRYRKGRLAELAKQIEALAGDAYERLHEEQRDALATLGADQAKRATLELRAVLGAGSQGRVPGTTGLGVRFFQSVIDSRPLEGALLRDWFADQERKTVFRVNQQLQLGVLNGETVDQMVRRIRGTSAGIVRGDDGKPLRTRDGGYVHRYAGGVMQTSTRDATAIVRTAVNQISTEARFAGLQAHSDITEEYQWISTLDSRTSPICQARDGKRYRYDDPSAPRPPAHFLCRSTIIPRISWAKLGLEPPPEGTRASQGGQVKSSTTYSDWLKSQPAALQDEILGPGRAQLFRDGRITLDELVKSDGRRVRLNELRAT